MPEHYRDWHHGVQDAIDADVLKKRDSLEELERDLGFAPGVLVEAVEKWNACCERGEDDFMYPMPPEWLHAIKDPPFYGCRIGGNLYGTKAGLMINDEMQVISTKGTVIPGLFLIALAVAIVGRIGLAVMDLTGTLSYDYISAADVPILDVVCSILTGSALVAFMYAASLAMVVSTVGVALHGLLFARRSEGAGRPATAFLWGWATALAAIVCLLITASGILSAVQVASMSSKLPSLPMLVLALVGFAAFLGTLLGAASMTVCACLARNLVLAAFVCGLVVMVLTVGTFSAVNSASIQLGTVGAWFAADVVVNLAIMFGMGALVKKGRA